MQKNMRKAAKAREKDNMSGGDEFEDDPATEADEGNYTYPDHLDDDDDEKEDQPTGRSIFRLEVYSVAVEERLLKEHHPLETPDLTNLTRR